LAISINRTNNKLEMLNEMSININQSVKREINQVIIGSATAFSKLHAAHRQSEMVREIA